ncbi:MAG: YeeE/YedE family protein, partial [Burkholderiales bacterium]|nr:YeeE/YedE family protein [Burkholderiales bacterium]
AHFSFWSALLGGSLIGLAASLLILFNGRVLGISGILGSLHQSQSGWRFAFLAGLLCAPIAYHYFYAAPVIEIQTSNSALLLAGLLVGVGTRFASGCTSGHGICGLARTSTRSLAATLTFMAAGFVTTYIVRHLIGN